MAERVPCKFPLAKCLTLRYNIPKVKGSKGRGPAAPYRFVTTSLQELRGIL